MLKWIKSFTLFIILGLDSVFLGYAVGNDYLTPIFGHSDNDVMLFATIAAYGTFVYGMFTIALHIDWWKP